MRKLEKRLLFVAIILPLVWRIYVLVNSQVSFYSDDAIYAEIARFWIQGKLNLVFHPTWPPLYPAISAFLFIFTKNWEDSLRLVSLISITIMTIPLFLLARKLTNSAFSFLFCLTISFAPMFLKIPLIPQSDMLSTLLIISAIVSFFFSITEGRSKLAYLSSFLFGLTFLTRSEGAVFFYLTFTFFIVYTVFQTFKKKNLTNLFKIIIFALIFIVTISPYWIATKIQTGSWSLSQKANAQIKQGQSFQLNKSGTTWIQEIVSVKRPNYKSEYFKNGLPHVLEYSDWFWFLFKQRFLSWKNVYQSLFPTWATFLIVIGIILSLGKKHFWSLGYFIFLLFAMIPLTIFATPIADIRYLLWSIPILLLLIYFAIFKIIFLFTKKHFQVVSIFSLIAISSVLIFPSLNLVLHPETYAKEFTVTNYREEIIQAGNWIKQNSKQKVTKIMMRHEGVEFYSDTETIYLPQDIAIDELISYAKKYNVDYIVAWKEELFADTKLSPLLSEDFKNKSLTKVFVFPSKDTKIIVYRLGN